MIFKDYYKILDLENSKVTLEQIKLAYRKQAKKYHPDVNIKANNQSEERFKDINEAYKVLSGDNSKRKYDRLWNSYIGKKKNKERIAESVRQKGSLFSDFFNMCFGNINEEPEEKTEERQLKIKGEDVETEINISLREAYYGMEKKITLRAVNRKNENIFY